jgi:CelD/BcsL family acetyltransferase involved in cellulose biosynthesis
VPGAVGAQAIERLETLEGLRPEWEQLWAVAANATPFQSPHWLLPWWKHIGRGTLASVALRSVATGELVGLAPLYIHTDPADGTRHLFPIGIATSDYLDVLVRPGWEGAVLQALAAHLRETCEAWDVFEAPELAAGAALLSLPVPEGWQREVAPAQPHPVLSLGGPEPWSAVPRGMRDNLRYCERRVARGHTIAHEVADAQSIPAFLDAFARLHAKRWNERGESGVLHAPMLAAHREAAPPLLGAGLLRLHGLRIDGELAAVLYTLADARRSYSYLAGFDPDLRALSPGTLVVARAIAHAHAHGAQAFDFLRGSEGHKYRWGSVDQPMYFLRLRHGSPGGSP